MAEGKTIFINDLSKPGMLSVLPLTAGMPGGNITSLKIPDPPRGYGVIRPEDVPGLGFLKILDDQIPLFAREQVAYQGQTILLVYGPDESEVRHYRDSIKVEYETDFSILSFDSPGQEQVIKEKKITRGRSPGKTGKAQVREDHFTFTLPFREDHKPQGAFAYMEKKHLTVYGSSQWPFFIRDSLMKILKTDEKQITFRTSGSGQVSDSPFWYPAFLTIYAALAAWITGKPCRLLLPKEESLLPFCGHNSVALSLLTSVGSDGRVLFRKIGIDIEAGAYSVFSEEILGRFCLSVLGSYSQGYAEVTSRLIRTARPPLDGFNGLGMAQGFCAIELHVGRVAGRLGEDPLDRKMTYCLRPGKPNITGGLYTDKTDPALLLETAARVSDFKRKHAAYQIQNRDSQISPYALNPRRGIGIALAYQGNGFLSGGENIEKFSLTTRLDKEGTLTIFTSSVPGNPRTEEVWKETAARILQIDPAHVILESIDTDKVPDSGPAFFSRNITIIPRLIEKACQSIQKKRFRAPLPLEMKRTFRIPRSQEWDFKTFQGQPFLSLSWAAAVVEVELEPVSTAPAIRGIWLVMDCGKLLDPGYARSVAESSVYNTLSWCTTRRPPPKTDAKHPSSRLNSGLSPTYPLRIQFMDSRSPLPGGLGSLAENTIPGAFLAALGQAAGREISSLPFIPEDLIHHEILEIPV